MAEHMTSLFSKIRQVIIGGIFYFKYHMSVQGNVCPHAIIPQMSFGMVAFVELVMGYNSDNEVLLQSVSHPSDDCGICFHTMNSIVIT